MKLFLNTTSPYARLVSVVLHEVGLDERVQAQDVDPWAEPEELLAVNPAAKIPALVTDSGEALIESTCICEYLIRLSGNQELLPTDAAGQLDLLQRIGLGRAAMDCGFGAVIQRRFQGARSSLEDLWLDALPRTAQALDDLYNRRSMPCPVDLGDLTVAVTFDYVDFRLPEIRWREHAPALAAWMEGLGERPSLQNTRPS